jgi:4-coumarate--CoA ligase
MAHHIKTTRSKFAICQPEILQPMLDAKTNLGSSNIFIFDTEGQAVPSGFKSWKWLFEQGEVDW